MWWTVLLVTLVAAVHVEGFAVLTALRPAGDHCGMECAIERRKRSEDSSSPQEKMAAALAEVQDVVKRARGMRPASGLSARAPHQLGERDADPAAEAKAKAEAVPAETKVNAEAKTEAKVVPKAAPPHGAAVNQPEKAERSDVSKKHFNPNSRQVGEGHGGRGGHRGHGHHHGAALHGTGWEKVVKARDEHAESDIAAPAEKKHDKRAFKGESPFGTWKHGGANDEKIQQKKHVGQPAAHHGGRKGPRPSQRSTDRGHHQGHHSAPNYQRAASPGGLSQAAQHAAHHAQ